MRYAIIVLLAKLRPKVMESKFEKCGKFHEQTLSILTELVIQDGCLKSVWEFASWSSPDLALVWDTGNLQAYFQPA